MLPKVVDILGFNVSVYRESQLKRLVSSPAPDVRDWNDRTFWTL
eukprot:COSAG01_NODE_6644_length_3566_cov_4.395443_4_plen_44_part_00